MTAIACGLLVGLAFAMACFVALGVTEPTTAFAIGLTGRCGFILFWMAYTGTALGVLLRTPRLRELSRTFGLAFAGEMLVHLTLLLADYVAGHTPKPSVLLSFGLGVIVLYAMTAVSFKQVADRWSGATIAKLRWIGMNYLLLLFALDFLRPVLRQPTGTMAVYLPLAILVVSAPAVRALASWRRLTEKPRSFRSKQRLRLS